MSAKIEIRSVEMVRRIRDEFAEKLKDKSHAEIVELFRKAGEAARKRAKYQKETQSQKESYD